VTAGDTGTRLGVLLAGDDEAWERPALDALQGARDLVLLRRCLDLTELLAAATSGTAQVAVVGHRSHGLDRDAVDRLAASGVRVVVVVADAGTSAASYSQERERLERLGAADVLPAAAIATDLARVVREAVRHEVGPPDPAGPTLLPGTGGADGRVVAVWGAHGAPGRTTVTVGLAADLASRGVPTVVVDADPHGGAVGQHLGVLDEASGLLGAVRLANAGSLDGARLAACARTVEPGLAVLTGLPRADRWQEVRPGPLADVLDGARALAEVVLVDAGAGLEPPPAPGLAVPRTREALVSGVLEAADEVLVVASPDPVGLTRLARALVDLRAVRPDGPAGVVVNRMRPGLGWRERDVADMVARVCPAAPVVFVPDDPATADKALVAGRTVARVDPRGSSRLAGGLARVAGLVEGQAVRR
jgi:MinD-like ATPase involved in chromosome partitioning or flagellar assembly